MYARYEMTTFQVPGVILYLAEEDLFRLGNATSPRLDNVRDKDVEFFTRNGIVCVRANGTGISLLTEEGTRGRKGGWLWKIPARIPLPHGLLYNNNRPGHYFLCPALDMPLDEYRGLLAKLAINCERVQKI